MNRLSITRKLQAYVLEHPKALEVFVKVMAKKPSLPKGYRRIMKK